MRYVRRRSGRHSTCGPAGGAPPTRCFPGTSATSGLAPLRRGPAGNALCAGRFAQLAKWDFLTLNLYRFGGLNLGIKIPVIYTLNYLIQI
jgi:hypothetical protein